MCVRSDNDTIEDHNVNEVGKTNTNMNGNNHKECEYFRCKKGIALYIYGGVVLRKKKIPFNW